MRNTTDTNTASFAAVLTAAEALTAAAAAKAAARESYQFALAVFEGALAAYESARHAEAEVAAELADSYCDPQPAEARRLLAPAAAAAAAETAHAWAEVVEAEAALDAAWSRIA